jgi:hypothetical protein
VAATDAGVDQRGHRRRVFATREVHHTRAAAAAC